MLLIFGLNEVNKTLGSGFIDFIQGFLTFGLFFYEYKAMRNFYQQRRAKTICKFILLNLMMIVVMILLFAVFAFMLFFKI